MEGKTQVLFAVLIVHATIGLVQFIVRRMTPLGRWGLFGIYMILQPIGFNCFGLDLSPLVVAGSALIGLYLLVRSIGKAAAARRQLV